MFLDDLAEVLVQASVGTLYPAGAIVLGEMPATPDQVLMLIETAGALGEKILSTPGIKYELPRAQLTARDVNYQGARILIQNAYDAINGVTNRSINGTCYLRMEPVQSPFFLQRDENDRYLLAFNAEAMRAIA